MKLIKEALPKIVNSGVSRVSYDKDSLLKSLTEDARPSKKKWGKYLSFPYYNLIRFILLLTVTIVTIALVLTFSLTYIKDVLLFKSNLSVNRQGVFMPSKTCGREYCLFLFNSSDLWANTGIYLNKGDYYKISVSGAFHSSARHMFIDAKDNNPSPEVIWIGGKKREEYFNNDNNVSQKEKKKYCIKPSTYIGTILFRIAPEYQLWDPDEKDSIYIWEPKLGEKYNPVDSPGVLTMAINDIYFKNDEALRMYADSFPMRLDTRFVANEILANDGGKNTYKRMFYDDNLGQILVCMEIQHPLPGRFFNPLTAFRNLDTGIELQAENTNRSFHLILKSIWPFIIFLLHICAIFIIIILSTSLVIYLIFMLGYWLYLLVTSLFRSAVKHNNRIKTSTQKNNNTTTYENH